MSADTPTSNVIAIGLANWHVGGSCVAAAKPMSPTNAVHGILLTMQRHPRLHVHVTNFIIA